MFECCDAITVKCSSARATENPKFEFEEDAPIMFFVLQFSIRVIALHRSHTYQSAFIRKGNNECGLPQSFNPEADWVRKHGN